MSALAISVMYTMAGLVPKAVGDNGDDELQRCNAELVTLPATRPVRNRPTRIIVTFCAVAIRIQPMTTGNTVSFNVFRRPIQSIMKPARIETGGTTTTMMLAAERSMFHFKTPAKSFAAPRSTRHLATSSGKPSKLPNQDLTKTRERRLDGCVAKPQPEICHARIHNATVSRFHEALVYLRFC